MSQITMRQMIEAGVHFGHQTRFWNPKMAQYIFGARNKIHIVNLEKTLPMFQEAQEAVRRLVANKGTVLFVGTKRQAREIIREEATRAGMPFVDHRWLGGMLTNYKTVKQSIKRLEEKTAALENAAEGGFNKKEILEMQRDVEKLERSLGGIKNMKGLPDAIFVIDTGYQKGTLVEAEKLGIPVIAVVDTNNSPDGVKYVIPGNDDSAKAIRLTRDVETNQATYVQLLAKQQELNIMKASAQGNVRVVDHAYTPEQPIAPRKAVITALSALAAGALASMWVMLQGRMRRGITSSEEIENLNLEVAALVPYSKTQQKRDLLKRKFKSLTGRSNYLLANEDASDVAVEAIRALRTNIYFSMLDASNNVLMITGAAPEAGKSFISANLATVMAQSGKRVLLIDTDMRKGYLDQLFKLTPEYGLADILSGHVSPAKAVCETRIENLHLISNGGYPKNPSELLMDSRFTELLANAQKRYDYVIIDTPPVLAVTDATIVGQLAGTVLLVSRYGNTTTRELEISADRLRQNKINIKGVILNGMKREANSMYDYYAYHSPQDGKKPVKKEAPENKA